MATEAERAMLARDVRRGMRMLTRVVFFGVVIVGGLWAWSEVSFHLWKKNLTRWQHEAYPADVFPPGAAKK